MKRFKSILLLPFLFIFCLVGLSPVVWAQEQLQDQDRIMEQDHLRLREQIHKETKLSKEELDSLNLQLREHLRLRGSGEQVRVMIREALKNTCKGTCLRESIGAMNRAMAQGLSENEAQKMVTDEVRMQVRERKRLNLNNEELGERVRNRVEEQLQFRKQMMEKKKIKLREREMYPGRKGGGAGMEKRKGR